MNSKLKGPIGEKSKILMVHGLAEMHFWKTLATQENTVRV